ncbi:MAG: DNA repair exonuclease [Desulfobacterales bacterium]|jgi:DNA repair exonuclease SbcCD nuclease subunit|nr:DNA repair exonuclease [Desulfobacterales bacterium]
MKPFAFVHSADLHLGSPFKGVSERIPHSLDVLRNATYDAFNALIHLCLESEAAFLLVAGDVIDDADHALRAQLAFRDAMVRLKEKEINAFVVHGNHDPAPAWSTRIFWPENLHLFRADTVERIVVRVDGVPTASISGISFAQGNEQRPLIEKFQRDHSDLFKIGLLHTSCGHHPDHTAYAPCTAGQLRETGFDYWALGHVHERAILSRAPYIAYPGNIQGLSIRETGARGCYLVRVDENRRIEVTFHPLDVVRWLLIRLDLSPIETLDNLDQALFRQMESALTAADGRSAIVRILLEGRSQLYSELRKEDTAAVLLERIRAAGIAKTPAVWVQDLQVNCLPPIDLTSRSKVDDFFGQVLREAKTLRLSTKIALNAAPGAPPETLAPALKDLFHHHRLARLLDPLSGDDCERLISEAEKLCLDLLEPDT